MKNLYYAEDNVYNYIIVIDTDKDENDSIIVNWDLSEEEIDEIVKAFETNEDDTSFYVNEDNEEWKPFEDIISGMNGGYFLT